MIEKKEEDELNFILDKVKSKLKSENENLADL